MTMRILEGTLACVLVAVVSVPICNAQATSVVPPAKPFLVVANQRSGVATLVDVATGRVSHVKLGGNPHEVAASPDEPRCRPHSSVRDVPPQPQGRRARSRDDTGRSDHQSRRLHRENADGGIAIFDLAKGIVVAKIPATQPRRITVTADGKRVVATDRDHLRIIDRATRQVRSLPLGPNAGGSGVACSPDSVRCYVALSQSGEIVEVDLRAARVPRRFAAQQGADGIAYVTR
jgi:DNA-binding beta-propeller fold protein YncE